MTQKLKREAAPSACGHISRRDFIGTTLIGAGVALLRAPCPAEAQDLGQAWTGYGGVGDYRLSNGNTASVVRSAHRIRDGAYDKSLTNVIDAREAYDLVIVGAGFAGMTALYEFKKAKPNGSCLVIDNHPIFGGEAKQNEFDVDGFRLTGPQGSNEFTIPKQGQGILDGLPYQYWSALGLPDHFEFAQRQGGDSSISLAKSNYDPMYWQERSTSVGYYFQNLTNGKGVWIKNVWRDHLNRAPLPESVKKDLLAWRQNKMPVTPGESDPRWLDKMTYAGFVTQAMGLGKSALEYVDPLLAGGASSTTSDNISAYAAHMLGMPGVSSFSESAEDPELSFPGGNTDPLRHFVKAVFPDAIEGPRRFDAIASNAVNFQTLDRPDAALRMRLSATAVQIRHEGEPASADRVSAVYEKDGQLYRVQAKAAVVAIGSWVARHIVTDLPAAYLAAFDQFFHNPILVVNVALRNWRFLDKLGISAARWFTGFGYFANIRQPMVVGDRPIPFHPDKPAVMTFYVPLVRAGLPIAAQGATGRAELYGTSYAEYERRITAHLQELFGVAGFDARRDVAGIVLNRWGHPSLAPQPGFFFGTDGKPAPRDIIRQRFGRIAFGHSELQGIQAWEYASVEGRRALHQVMEVL